MALELLPASIDIINTRSMNLNLMNRAPAAEADIPHLDLYGDVLEAVVTLVPTVDLIPASRVSREWRAAVRSSLRRLPRRSPWLLLRHPGSLHAFDPFSSSWLSLPPNSPSIAPSLSFLRGSSGDRLHALSISTIAISTDPFATAWRQEAKAPKVWRQDAVVAQVGRWIVVAGGGCPMVLDEGEEVGAVEVYDKQAGMWESAEPMPPAFDGSTSATWLSVAASHEKMYVMEKKTGLVGSFDPKSKRWGLSCQLRLDPAASAWAIALGRNGRVLVVGVGQACQSGTEVQVRLRELNPETMRPSADGDKLIFEEQMPKEMVERLFPVEEEDDGACGWQSCSVEVCGTERGGYVYNPSAMRNGAVLYELAEDNRRIVGRWEWVPLPESVGENGMGRIEFGCSAVGLDELASFWTH